MKDERKSRKQLIDELAELRQRVVELETVVAQRERAEEAYRALVEHSLQGIGIAQDGQLVFVNAALAQMYDYDSPEEMLTASPEERIARLHPEDRGILEEFYNACVDGKAAPSHYEYRVIWKDGTVRWLEQYATVIEHRGRPAVQAVAIDITERKQAEEELGQRTAQLEALREVGLRLTAQLDLDALLHSVVSRAIDLLGGGAGGIYLYRPEREVLEWAVTAGPKLAPVGVVLHKGEGLSGKVWEAGEPLVVDDYGHWDGRAAIYDGHQFTAIAAAPIHMGDQFLGVLNVLDEPPRTFSPSDLDTLTMFTTQAAAAIQNARLYEEVQASQQQLRDLASYLQAAREEERARIAREIHDEFGQALTALKMDLFWLSHRLPPDKVDMVTRASAMSDLIDSIIQMVWRVATELRPGLLDDLGLFPAIEWQTQEFSERTGINCRLVLNDEDVILDRDLATAIFRILQETLTNVARHSEATEVRVSLKSSTDELILVVLDNGIGIGESQVSDPTSLGLIGMRERVRPWGGDITFEGRPGQGTTVTVRVPLHKPIQKHRAGYHESRK